MALQQIDFLLNGIQSSSGTPLASGKVYTYEAGTTTDKATYTDQSGSTAAANPVILDSTGAVKVYGSGNYKFVIKTSADVTLYTYDNVYITDIGSSTDFYGGSTGGSSNTYTATLSPALAAYAAGQRFTLVANHTNTGAGTLNVNGLGAKTIKLRSGHALIGGEIVNGRIIELTYNGTDMILTKYAATWTDWTPTIAIGGAGSWGSATIHYAKFLVADDLLHIRVRVLGTISGTAADYFTCTTPIALDSPDESLACGVHQGSAFPLSGTCMVSSTTFLIYKYDKSTIATGGTSGFRIHGAVRRP